jgi:hypothetical protein
MKKKNRGQTCSYAGKERNEGRNKKRNADM